MECTWRLSSLDGLGSPQNVGQPNMSSTGDKPSKKQNLSKKQDQVLDSELKKSISDSQKERKQDVGETK